LRFRRHFYTSLHWSRTTPPSAKHTTTHLHLRSSSPLPEGAPHIKFVRDPGMQRHIQRPLGHQRPIHFLHARTASAMDMDYKWFMSSPRSTRDSLLTCHHRRRAHSSSAQVSEREDKGGRETASPKNKRHHTHTDTHRIHLHIHLYPTSR